MKRWKKWVVLSLCGCLTIGGLSGCGSDSESQKDESYSAEELNYSEQADEPIKSYFRYKLISEKTEKAVAADSVGGQSVGFVDNHEGLFEEPLALWRIDKSENGGYSVRNAYSNLFFGTVSSGMSQRLIQTARAEEKTFNIVQSGEGYSFIDRDGKYLEAKQASLVLSEKREGDSAFVFRIEEVREFENLGAYKILDSEGNALFVDSEKKIGTRAFSGTHNEQWFFSRSRLGLYTLTNIGSCYHLGDSEQPEMTAEFNDLGSYTVKEVALNRYKLICYETNKELYYDNGLKMREKTEETSGKSVFTIMPVCRNYPVPRPLKKAMSRTVALNRCDLWSRPTNWNNIKRFPELRPVLGWYEESAPIVTDWEINFTASYGIDFTMSCWYRDCKDAGYPQTVKGFYDNYIETYEQAQWADCSKYCIMFTHKTDDSQEVYSVIGGLDDWNNVMAPYFVEMFKRPNYKKIDNKPVFVMFRMELAIQEMGGEANMKTAIDRLDSLAKEAGFDGVHFIGQACNETETILRSKKKEMGFDAIMSYHLPTLTFSNLPVNPTAKQIIDSHVEYWNDNDPAIPYMASVSVGWDSIAWGNSHSSKKWRLTKSEYAELLSKAKAYGEGKGAYSSELIWLDNWNEYGEGHSIMPDAREGFGYLEAVYETLKA